MMELSKNTLFCIECCGKIEVDKPNIAYGFICSHRVVCIRCISYSRDWWKKMNPKCYYSLCNMRIHPPIEMNFVRCAECCQEILFQTERMYGCLHHPLCWRHQHCADLRKCHQCILESGGFSPEMMKVINEIFLNPSNMASLWDKIQKHVEP